MNQLAMDAASGLAEGPAGMGEALWEHFGQTLLASGQINDTKLQRARASAEKSGESLAAILIKLGLCSEEAVAATFAGLLDLEHVRAAPDETRPAALAGLRQRFLSDADVFPIRASETDIVLAMANPLDDETAQAVALKTGKLVIRAAAARSDIRSWLSTVSQEEAPESGRGEPADAADTDIERLADLARGAPVIGWVEDVLAIAVEAGASDIHIEPERDALRVRMRVDGALVPVNLPVAGKPEALVSRVKVLAKLNIAERRLPQDGRIRTAIRGKEIDLRVATMPSLHGEALTLRLLDQTATHLDLETLGLSSLARDRLTTAIARPEGITLVSGPTGSGKTTTLYACLKHLMNPQTKFMSVEDPVEYEISGVSQIQVKAEIGMTFSRALRSVLRHNPDVLMIGEIRDAESAKIAVEAALTGHMVLSTIHTNNAPATITRLLEMGIEDYLLASTLNAVSAQRLLRRLCSSCKQPAPPAAGMEAKLMSMLPAGTRPSWAVPVGCPACRGTGYQGRIAVAEVMPLTPAIEAAMLERASESHIREIALGEGMQPLFVEGLSAVVAGETSLAELFAVIGQRMS